MLPPPRSIVELDARIDNLFAALSAYRQYKIPPSSTDATNTGAERYQRIVNQCLTQAGQQLGADIPDAGLDAVEALLAGSAVEFIDPVSGQGGATLYLLLAGCLLGAAGVPTHLVFSHDQVTEMRFNMVRDLIDRLDISAAMVTTHSSKADRNQAYQRNLVFCSVKECALDRLRDRKRWGRDAGDTERKLHYLRSATRGEGQGTVLENHPIRFALIEDIDQLLLDSAMTPVQLFEGDPDAAGSHMAGNEVAESASFFGVFSSYGKLAGIGEGLDRQTEKGFSHYRLPQLQIDGMTEKLPNMVRRQEQPMVSRIVLLAAGQPIQQQLASYLQMLCSKTHTVIVDQIAEEELATLTTFLGKKLNGIDVSNHLSANTNVRLGANPGCILLTDSMSNMVDGADIHTELQDDHVHVISFAFESSYRAQLKKYRRVRRVWRSASFDIVVTGDYAGLSLSSLNRSLLSLLPPPLRRTLVSALIRHRQKENDRHRARSTESLIRYEKELDDLLAFSG